jgi:23S rRNA pseudouridine1911/1915/1917 synthase
VEEAGTRLDSFLANRMTEYSRGRLKELIECGELTLNGRRVKPATKVSSGDRIEGTLSAAPAMNAAAEKLALQVVYRDADLAVIDKPAGMVVHPAPGHESGTLANAVAAEFPETVSVGGLQRPGIVHRLDKDTSGLIVVALSAAAHQSLQQQLSSRAAGREYLALVQGHPKPAEGVIDAPKGRDRSDRKRMAAHGVSARAARTSYSVMEDLGPYSLVRAKLQSGRTHQIRVHFSAIGHPIVGDARYRGPVVEGLQRQFLHAVALTLESPSTGEQLSFQSELPPDLQGVLDRLRQTQYGQGSDPYFLQTFRSDK